MAAVGRREAADTGRREVAEAGRREEAAALLALSRGRKRGTAGVRHLVERHGSGRAALAVTGGRALAGLDRARASIAGAEAGGVAVVTWSDPAYPAGLSDLAHPPPVIFIEGSARFDHARSVAIVGTRAASDYGRRAAYGLAHELGRWGWTVVSGMARGIDGEAHAGVLDAGAPSIGVLGHGHATEYPREHRDLYARMRVAGLLVSEFEPDARPRRSSFPRRNRLIAALSRAVIVVEAGTKSGALITAGLALDLGREVLAVPGRIDDPAALGVCGLLRDGAGVVTRARDVFDALGWLHDGRLPAPEAPAEEPGDPVARASGRDRDILRAIARAGRSADEIAARTGSSIASTLSRLGRLELEGWVERRPDGSYRTTRETRVAKSSKSSKSSRSSKRRASEAVS